MDLSLVVITFDMRREAARTLHSLSRVHQHDLDDVDYEVIVVDNGSAEPLVPDEVAAHGPEFRLVTGAPGQSPLRAANRAVAASSGTAVGVVLDGACLVTPGAVSGALRAQRAYGEAFATAYAWHLGSDPQPRATQAGYDEVAEDRLLAEAAWPQDGYGVFRSAVLDPSNPDGWFGPVSECRFFVLPRTAWEALGGYDERFEAIGGGLGGVEFYRRVSERPDLPVVGLLGEGTFHQVHGGVTTSSPVDRWRQFHDEYVRIAAARGRCRRRRGSGWVRWARRPASGWRRASSPTSCGGRSASTSPPSPCRAAASSRSRAASTATAGSSGSRCCRIAPDREAFGVELHGWLTEREPAPMRLEVRVGDAEPHVVDVIPGTFLVDVPVRLPADAEVDLAVDAGRTLPPDMLGGDEDRALSWQVEAIRLRGPLTDPRTFLAVDGARVGRGARRLLRRRLGRPARGLHHRGARRRRHAADRGLAPRPACDGAAVRGVGGWRAAQRVRRRPRAVRGAAHAGARPARAGDDRHRLRRRPPGAAGGRDPPAGLAGRAPAARVARSA